jgi:hypothetical protein
MQASATAAGCVRRCGEQQQAHLRLWKEASLPATVQVCEQQLAQHQLQLPGGRELLQAWVTGIPQMLATLLQPVKLHSHPKLLDQRCLQLTSRHHS